MTAALMKIEYTHYGICMLYGIDAFHLFFIVHLTSLLWNEYKRSILLSKHCENVYECKYFWLLSNHSKAM